MCTDQNKVFVFIPSFTLIYETSLQIDFFSFMAQQPPVGQGLLIVEASQSHSRRHHTR
jgi:hypothetical protein